MQRRTSGRFLTTGPPVVSTFERRHSAAIQKSPVKRGDLDAGGGTRLALVLHDYARFEPHWTRWGGEQLSGK
jgi:hypothetical protein